MADCDYSGNIHSFKPIIDEHSQVLILGSIPGPESLRMHQYYANPNNQFWRIIHKVFCVEITACSYEEKARFLLDHKIALWDVYHSADRRGALDADIKNPEPNDLHGLLQKHPCINRILLAGRTAEKAFRRHFSDIGVDAYYVPSASSAYAKLSIDKKVNDWKTAIGVLPGIAKMDDAMKVLQNDAVRKDIDE